MPRHTNAVVMTEKDARAGHRLAMLLALLIAAIVATGCGDDAASEPDISDITSDPEQYVGETVDLRGEVSEIFHLRGGFLLDEADGGGDDLIVYDAMLPLGVVEGDEVQVKGTVELVDDDFRKGADDGFFDDLVFDDVKGQAAVDASSIVDPSAPPAVASVPFDTVDANGDSWLDHDEIRESADASGVFDIWNADADSELDPDQIAGNAFKLWDRDGDKKLSREEWETGAELWYPDDAAVAVFDDVDGDGDSELDVDEFAERFDVSALGEAWQPGNLSKSQFRSAYFSLYDTDDDGRVSRDEWAAGPPAFGLPAS